MWIQKKDTDYGREQLMAMVNQVCGSRGMVSEDLKDFPNPLHVLDLLRGQESGTNATPTLEALKMDSQVVSS